MNETSTDVLVIGGGLVGGPLACALATSGVSVTVIDSEDPATALRDGFDGRTSAIALAGKRLLAAVGLWPEIAPQAAPIKQIRVADGRSSLFVHYDHQALGEDPFGWIVDNRVIRNAIVGRLRQLPTAIF
jgi:2-octaprenyl-6-methoxyphenol hydroxylase